MIYYEGGEGGVQVIAQAISAACQAMPSLVKSDRNTHGNYNFVSIDDYYDQVAKVAVKEGLVWTICEKSAEIVDAGRANALRVGYVFDLIHAPSGKVISNFFSCTILHPLQGAQTSGSAMSYAVKLFLRSTFHVVTGEQDADTTDSNAFDMSPTMVRQSATPKAVPKAVEKEVKEISLEDKAEADTIIQMVAAMMPLATTKPELRKFWTDNEVQFKRLKDLDEAAYAKFRADFRTANEGLKA